MARKDDFPVRVLGMTVAVVVFVAMAGIALAVVARERAPREAVLGRAGTTTAALELALPGRGERGPARPSPVAAPATVGFAPVAPTADSAAGVGGTASAPGSPAPRAVSAAPAPGSPAPGAVVAVPVGGPTKATGASPASRGTGASGGTGAHQVPADSSSGGATKPNPA